MRFPGTIVFAPEHWFIVVEHGAGFTLVELDEEDAGMNCGDVLHAKSWQGSGMSTLSCGNVIYRGMLWGSHVTRGDAMRKALQFVTKQD